MTGFNSGGNSGDAIDLMGFAHSTAEAEVWNGAAGTLTLYNATTTDSLKLAGTYSQGSFALTTDSSTGTEAIANPTMVTVNGLSSGNAERGDP